MPKLLQEVTHDFSKLINFYRFSMLSNISPTVSSVTLPHDNQSAQTLQSSNAVRYTANLQPRFKDFQGIKSPNTITIIILRKRMIIVIV